jgi:hypothetical protein
MNFQDPTQTMKKALSTMSDEAFQQAGSALSESRKQIRETLQSETSDDIKNIIHKLSSDQPLSASEMNLVRLWIIGDAESYTMMENSLQEWIVEYERLEKTLTEYAGKTCTAEDFFKLYGILEDAI